MEHAAEKPVHGGDVWRAQQHWGLDPDQILDFSANINPLGPSPQGMSALKSCLDRLIHYPEPTGESLKIVLGQYLKVDPANLVLGNGGSELIYLFSRMFYKHRIVLLAPCFAEYGEGVFDPRLHCIPLQAEEKFRLPLNRILAEMRSEDLLFIGNPNNPTGNAFERDELLQIVSKAGECQAMVVIDEAFLDFLGDENRSVRQQATVDPHLIVVSSLTKFFAIPGLRLGYAVARPSIIHQAESLLPTWRVNTLALEAGKASLQDQTYIKATLAFMDGERRFLLEQLRHLAGLEVFPGQSNFLLVNAETSGLTAAQWQEHLGPWGILIRNCGNFKNLSPYYFRVAVKQRQQNLHLLKALRDVLDSVR